MQRFGFLGVAAMVVAVATPYGSDAGEVSRREALRLQAMADSLAAAVGEVAWSCTGERCVGAGPRRLESMMKACRRAAEAIGPLAAYQRGDRRLSPREVATCNRLAGVSDYHLAAAGR